MKIIQVIYRVFDKLEDNVRGALSHHPFIYTFFGGVGIVLFWRGVWHMADTIEMANNQFSFLFSPLGSTILGVIILLSTGLFVSMFIGDSIIISGIKKDKKRIEKTIEEVEEEEQDIKTAINLVKDVKEEVKKLESEVRS